MNCYYYTIKNRKCHEKHKYNEPEATNENCDKRNISRQVFPVIFKRLSGYQPQRPVMAFYFGAIEIMRRKGD